MKRKELIKKGIAGCMAALMTLSSMPVPPAYASDNASTELDVSEEAAEGSNERESDAASEEVAETISPLSITPYVPETSEPAQPEKEDLPANVLKGKDECYGLDMQLTSDKDFPANSESLLSIIQDGNQIQEYLGDINESILAKNNQQASGYILPIEISVFDSADEDRKELKDLGKINVNIETESAGEVKGYRLFHMKADTSWEELAFKVDGKDINFKAEELGKFIWVNVPGGDGEKDKVVTDEAVNDSTGNGQQKENKDDITMTTAGELKDKKPESEEGGNQDKENKKNDISKDLTVNDAKPQKESSVAGNEEGEKEAEKKADEKTGSENVGETEKEAGITESEETAATEDKDESGEEAGEETGNTESKDDAEDEEAGDEENKKAGKELADEEGAGNEKADAEQAGDESDVENAEAEGKEEDWAPDNLDEAQTEAIPNGSVFDAVQNVNGVNVRVHAQAGVFPDGCSMQAEEVSNTEIQERVADAISKAEYQNPVKSYYYNITIYDKDGNEIEPDTTKGKVSVSFDMDELQDKNLDASVYHIDDNFNADILGSVNNSLAVVENGADVEKEETTNVGKAAEDMKGEAADIEEKTGEAENETASAADEADITDETTCKDEEAESNELTETDDGTAIAGSLMINSSMSNNELTVSTDAFSFYAVSFTYNNKSYDMMAGEEVDLSTIKASVGLSGDITNAVSSDKSKLSITKEETADSSGNVSVVWKVKPDETFAGAATLTLTINNVDYVINVTVVNSYNKFALLFEDGTLIFVNKSRDLKPLIVEHGKITHKYVVSETSNKHDWTSENKNIKKVIVIDTIKLTNAAQYFGGCSNVSEFVGLENIDMSECTSVAGMFYGCNLLKEIDLSMWNVGKCQAFGGMFSSCQNIKKIDLHGWTFNETSWDMDSIFGGMLTECSSLESLNMNGWSLPKVDHVSLLGMTNGGKLNQDCYINLDNWRFKKATSLENAFYQLQCNDISIKNWDVSTITNFNGTFQFTSINTLNLAPVEFWNVSHGKSFKFMFANIMYLKSLNLSRWNMNNAECVNGMFSSASYKATGNILNISGWHFSRVDRYTFSSYDYLSNGFLMNANFKEIKLNNWVWDRFSGFEYSVLSELGAGIHSNGYFEFRNLTIKASNTQKFCEKNNTTNMVMNSIDVSGWNLPNPLNDFSYMFYGIYPVDSIDCSRWVLADNTQYILDEMFNYASTASGISVNGWSINNDKTKKIQIYSARYLFGHCSQIKSIAISNWRFVNYDSSESTLNGFAYDCHQFSSIAFTNCEFASGTASKFMEWLGIQRAFPPENTMLDLSHSVFEFNGRSASKMFADTNLETINLSCTRFVGASDFSYMFANDYYLKNIISQNMALNGTDINITGMFKNSFQSSSGGNYNINLSSIIGDSTIAHAEDVFTYCYSLNKVDCRGLTFSGTDLDVNGFFGFCPKLSSIDCSGWKANKVTSLENLLKNMFTDTRYQGEDAGNSSARYSGREFLNEIIINGWSFPNVTNIKNAFANMPNLKKITCLGGKFGNATNAEGLFLNDRRLQIYDISGIDLSKITSLKEFFKNSNIQHINSADFKFMKNINSVTNADEFVSGCVNLKALDVAWWNTSGIKTAKDFAKNTRDLSQLDLRGWDTSNIANNGLDAFANPSGIQKLKLSKSFKFPAYNEFGLPDKKWSHVKDNKIDISSVDLWSKYDQSDKMAGTWVVDEDVLDLDNTISFDSYSYDTDTNTLFAYIDIHEGQTVAPVTMPNFYPSKILMGDDFFNKCHNIKDFIANGDFKNKTLKFKIQAKAYTDIVSCSRNSKVLWTFNVPKNNKSLIKINITDSITHKSIGYIKNTMQNPNIFIQYDADGNRLETLNPGNRHTYQDLGYTVDKYVVTQGGQTIREDYYKDYGDNLTIYKDSNQYGYVPNDEHKKLLSDYIYPEYKDYISYNSDMSNYEAAIAPGHYIITITNDDYESIILSPDKIITKTIDKTDNNGNQIQITIPDKYQYNVSKNIINENEYSMTLFNHIYKDSKTEITSRTVTYETIEKVDEYNESISAEFLVQSSFTHDWYLIKSTSEIKYYTRLYPVEIENVTYGPGDYILHYHISGDSRNPYDAEVLTGFEITPDYRHERNAQSFSFIPISTEYKTIKANTTLIYNDGTTTEFLATYECKTCMEYGQCTCNKFGNCNCDCCGIGAKTTYINSPPIKIRNNKKTIDTTTSGSVKVTNVVDDSVTDVNKQHTSFHFSIYDKSNIDKLACSYTIKAGESFTLSTQNLIDGHRYRIVEESCTNDLYSPSDTTIVETGSANDTDHKWTSDKLYYEFTYSDSPAFKREYTFTNHYNQQKHNITVEKHLTTDNSSNKDKTTNFNFTMQLTNPLLSLSDFEITYQKSDGSNGKVTLDTDGKYTFTLKDGQTIKFLDIPDATTYKFTEEKSGIYHSKDNGTANGILLEKDANVTFNNDRIDIINLPKTGGDGNTLPYAMLFVVTVSLMAAARREKKKQKR